MSKKMCYIPFELGWEQAFDLLLQVLDMTNIVNSEEELYIHKGRVCRKDRKTGEYEIIDDRADLFAALRNVVNAMVPNLDYRSDPYITNWGNESPTNGDLIRRMSNEELISEMGGWTGFGCNRCTRDSNTCDPSNDCQDGIYEWLCSEAEEKI